ncbi:PTS sugar transporter subunit IIA [Litorihabitans aurantiacus]|uniref:PTS glucose transporter subunit IIA n=1 Tax=Litorihabitans aurantiacus TaxID=1930061 RepID=A0AA37XG50_9MICO|nr:PTS glucose transporter subunit IIA [Litorihabitans aurantiacus]GMA32639.1 PTS glucose transporter subunit IIA [Litorihabitans aurantiacus]
MTTPAATPIHAPLAGRVSALADVPDPVFAEGIMGEGAAIEPPDAVIDVVAPVSGTLLKVLPHAFVILTPAGWGVLVHLGIDTVRLEGAGFTVHVTQGDEIEAGAPVVTYDVPAVRAAGVATVVPVVPLEHTGAVALAEGLSPGDDVTPGSPFLTLTA